MRVIALFSAFVIAASVAGHATAAPQGKRVVLLSTANTQAYMGAWTATFMKSAGALGIKATNFTSPFDAALQSQQIDDAIAQKPDLILIVTINHHAILPALMRAKAADVPVMLVVNPGEKGYEDLYVSYVGTDQQQLGRLAGENLVKGLAEEGKTAAQVAAVTGTASQLNSILRMAGFREVLSHYPGIKLVAEEDGKWNTAPSEKITSDLLVRFSSRGGLDGIYAMADNQATGAIQAIQSAGLKAGVAQKGIVVVAEQLHEGRHHPHQGRLAVRDQYPDPGRGSRGRSRARRRLFQRQAAQEERDRRDLLDHQAECRQIRRGLQLLNGMFGEPAPCTGSSLMDQPAPLAHPLDGRRRQDTGLGKTPALE